MLDTQICECGQPIIEPLPMRHPWGEPLCDDCGARRYPATYALTFGRSPYGERISQTN